MDFADSKRLTAAGARKMMAAAIARAQEAEGLEPELMASDLIKS